MLRSAFAAIGLLTVHASQAEPLHVPSQYPTIQAAIDASQSGDEIHIAPGVYRELLNPENKSVTLIGAGAGETILSGDLDGDTVADGVILDYQNEGADVLPFITLTGLAMTDAISGLTFRRAANASITGCAFINCSKGVHLEDGQFFDPYLFNLTIADTLFTGSGSGIDVQAAIHITLVRTTFAELTDVAANLACESIDISDSLVTACTGLGLAVSAESGTIAHTTFQNNTSDTRSWSVWNGNSLSVVSLSDISVVQCDFMNNGTLNDPSCALFIDFHFSMGSVAVTDCAFLGNRGSKHSAANVGGISHFLDCTFRNNASEGTGPINFAVSTIPSTVVGCMFERNGQAGSDGNPSTAGGGGLCVEGGSVLIHDSVFRNNLARSAGAVMLTRGRIGITSCRFEGNHATYEAGAVRVSPNAGSYIANSTLVGNTTQLGYGGAIWTRGDLPATNNVFLGNTAKYGEVVFSRGTSNFDSSIGSTGFIHNIVLTTNSQSLPFESYFGPVQVSTISNLVTTDLPSIRFTRPPTDGGDGFGDDPRTPDIDESLNDDYGDLRLLQGSPAIDAGGNAKLPRDIFDLDRDDDHSELLVGTTDLAGNPRFVDDPDAPNLYDLAGQAGPIDLGPYEFQPALFEAPNCAADTNNDGVLTPADFTAWIAAFNAGAPECDQNADELCTPADFTAWIANFNAGC